MRTVLNELYLNKRFTIAVCVIIALFMASFAVSVLFPIAQASLIILFVFCIADIRFLFSSEMEFECERVIPKLLSLSDENKIELIIQNLSPFPYDVNIIDELPVQFQRRDFEIISSFEANELKELTYSVRPTERGEYRWGKVRLFCTNKIGLLTRRITLDKAQMTPVYPSVIQMKNFELMAFSKTSHFSGVKKLRRIGLSYEFEQIKKYVKGDDYRHVNWKATSRRNELMVNQFQTERSQNVYSIICNSREMKMPFNELSLLDYAVNSSLVISNIALHKYDKAGLITFSDEIGSVVKADNGKFQLNKIFEALYNEKQKEIESGYDLLFKGTKNLIKHRSLLFLFTNFESSYALERALPVLTRLNTRHLLVVMFFKNTEIIDYAHETASDLKAIYNQTIAKRMISEKHKMLSRLNRFGIQAILNDPKQLSLNTVNKYMELKARGLI